MKNKWLGDTHMRVFMSWSGDLSKQIADCLNKWIPCLLQTVEIFYSPDDIEKGENWDQRISSELTSCNFGIICLTAENVSAPWVNFEAGAIAKALESRVATLMININPSDIKGPLSRYQATKLEKDDFFHLIQDINTTCDSPIERDRLSTTFEGLWSSIEKELNGILQFYRPSTKVSKKAVESASSIAIEEILQLVRKQTTILSSPEQLLPREYIEYVLEVTLPINLDTIDNLLAYLDFVYDRLRDFDSSVVGMVLTDFKLMEFIQSLGRSITRRNRSLFEHYSMVRRKFMRLYSSTEGYSIDEKNQIQNSGLSD